MREGRHMDKKIKKAIAEVVQILFGTGLFGDCSGYCEHTYGCDEDI